jgi:hypothetical protein
MILNKNGKTLIMLVLNQYSNYFMTGLINL